MTYAIEPVKMQDTHAIRYDIWDLEADEPIVQTFDETEAERICDELNGISSGGPVLPGAQSPAEGPTPAQPLVIEKPGTAGETALNFETGKNGALLASQANLLPPSPGLDFFMEEERSQFAARSTMDQVEIMTSPGRTAWRELAASTILALEAKGIRL